MALTRVEASRRFYLNHKEEILARCKKYNEANCEKIKEQHNKYRKRTSGKDRDTVYAHYGNKCVCPKCPETNPAFLTIDHITKEAKLRDKGLDSRRLYLQLIRLNFPSDVRLLCFNCNTAREFRSINGICPHMLA